MAKNIEEAARKINDAWRKADIEMVRKIASVWSEGYQAGYAQALSEFPERPICCPRCGKEVIHDPLDSTKGT